MCYDLTKDERKELKSLVEKAKQQTKNSKEFVYKVRGPPGKMEIKITKKTPTPRNTSRTKSGSRDKSNGPGIISTKTPNEIKCMFFNADTLTNKIAEFEFIVKEHKPLIIGVNEVLPKNFKRLIYPEEFQLANYEMITHPNVENNSNRCSILYVHKSLTFKQIVPDTLFEENIMIEIKLQNDNKLLCGNFYRRGDCSSENNDNLIKLLHEMNHKGYSHLLYMGDFNLPGIDWDTWSYNSTNVLNYENQFIECLRDCYLFQHITQFTRKRGSDYPSVLDLVFTNEENMVQDVELIAPVGKSDHSKVLFNFVGEICKKSPHIQTFYHKGNY